MLSYPRKMTRPRHALRLYGVDAFTLLEMSIVLIIIAVILAGGAVTFSASLQQRQYNQTKEKLVVLQSALRDYWRVFGRLPCPGDLTIGVGVANFGKEAANKGRCDGTPSANFVRNVTDGDATLCTSGYTSSNFSAEDNCANGGMVPVQTLQLPDDYAFDGWGRRILYVVDSDYTIADAAAGISVTADSSGTPNRIIIKSGATAASSVTKTVSAAYALVSFGINGHGAYSRTGSTRVSSGSANDMEVVNCHCNSSAVATTFTNTFYQSPYKTSTTVTTDTFDDMVVFGTRGTLYSASQ